MTKKQKKQKKAERREMLEVLQTEAVREALGQVAKLAQETGIMRAKWLAMSADLHRAQRDRDEAQKKAAEMEEVAKDEMNKAAQMSKVPRDYCVLDNSDAFRNFLDERNIKWKAAGHGTLLHPDANAFTVGREFEKHYQKNFPNSELNNAKRALEFCMSIINSVKITEDSLSGCQEKVLCYTCPDDFKDKVSRAKELYNEIFPF